MLFCDLGADFSFGDGGDMMDDSGFCDTAGSIISSGGDSVDSVLDSVGDITNSITDLAAESLRVTGDFIADSTSHSQFSTINIVGGVAGNAIHMIGDVVDFAGDVVDTGLDISGSAVSVGASVVGTGISAVDDVVGVAADAVSGVANFAESVIIDTVGDIAEGVSNIAEGFPDVDMETQSFDGGNGLGAGFSTRPNIFGGQDVWSGGTVVAHSQPNIYGGQDVWSGGTVVSHSQPNIFGGYDVHYNAGMDNAVEGISSGMENAFDDQELGSIDPVEQGSVESLDHDLRNFSDVTNSDADINIVVSEDEIVEVSDYGEMENVSEEIGVEVLEGTEDNLEGLALIIGSETHNDSIFLPFCTKPLFAEDLESFNPDMTNNDLVVGDPARAMDHWMAQGDTNRCALFAQKFIIEEITGEELSIDKMVEVATENGWFTESGGTSPFDMNKMLDLCGIENKMSFGNELEDLQQVLANGGRAIVAIDADEIWNGEVDGFFSPLDAANHAVEVIGIDYSDGDNPMVILNDSGNAENGCGEMIPLEKFMDAWADSDCQMVEVV